MKRLLIFILAFLLIGCATSNLEKKADELEKRIARAEMMAATGSAAANFYPARDVDWEGTGQLGGDLDDIASTADQDAGFVSILGETYFGPTLNWFGVYVLDVDSNQTQDVPWIVDADDGGQEDWLLADTLLNRIYSKTYVSPETAATVTVNDYDSGTYFANTDADDIEFDLPADPTDLVYCFGNGQTGGTVISNVITLDPDAADYIILDGSVTSSAGNPIVATTGSGKDTICIAGLDSSYWKVTGYQGSWAELDWSHIELFYRMEALQMSNPGDKFDASDDTWAFANHDLSTDAEKYGTKGYETDTGSDYLTLAPTAGNYPSDSVSVGFWFDMNTAPAGNVQIFRMDDGGFEERMFIDVMTDGDVRCILNQGGNPQITLTTTAQDLSDNAYHFVQCSFDATQSAGSDYMEIFVDGVSRASSSSETVTAWGSLANIQVGNIEGDASLLAYWDNLIFSNDHTINLYNEGYAGDISAP